MQSQKKKLLAVAPNHQFSSPLLGAIKPFFEIQLAGSLDAGIFLLKEWEPDIVILDTAEPLDTLPAQSDGYFDAPEKTLILLTSGLSKGFERYHKWNAAGVIELTDSPDKVCFQVRAIANKVSKLTRNQAETNLQAEDSGFKEFLGLKIYENDYMVKRGDQILTTTPTQFKLLVAFTNHPDQLLSRAWIKEQVWSNSDISPRSIDAQISKLKKLLPELDGCLMNIYGKGYILAESQHKNVA